MELRELRYIQEIARTKNLTKAADNLYVSQPNLSKVIRKLEEELGTPLFYREGKQLFPTEAGLLLIDGAGTMLQQMESLEEKIYNLTHLSSGKVTLGLPAVVARIWFPNIIVDFKSKYPDIELCLVEGGGMEMQEKVISGEVDLCISMRPIVNPDLNEFVLASNELAAAMNPDHPLAERQVVQLEDLASYAYTTFDPGYCINMQLNERLKAMKLKGKAALLAREVGLLAEYSKATGALCLAPTPVLMFYEWPGMVIKPFSPKFPWELSIVYKKNAFLSPAAREFLHTIINHFQERGKELGLLTV